MRIKIRKVLSREKSTTFNCQSYGKSFKQKHSLQKHIFRMHIEPQSRHTNKGRDKNSLQSKKRERKLTAIRAIRRHMKRHDKNRKQHFDCSSCGRCFNRKYSLQRHITKLHMETRQPRIEFDLSSSQCKICNDKFRLGSALQKHMKLHDEIRKKRFHCDSCGNTFTRKDSLKRHILSLHIEFRNPQTDCEIKCEKCNKKFTVERNLRQHMKVHDENRKKSLKCNECSSSFFGMHEYRRHMRTFHEGSSVYECSKCGRKFRRKDNLKEHIFTVHNDFRSKYECNDCGALTYTKEGMISHIWRRCTSIKKVCVICFAPCSNKVHLREHYSKKHQVNIVHQDLEFATKQDFLKWKKNMEDATNSRFIISNQKSTSCYHRTTFLCHRSGFVKIKSHGRQRRLKFQGSKKINGECPAEIMLREMKYDLTCRVSFIKTHVGHTLTAEDEMPHLITENRDERKKTTNNRYRRILRSRNLNDREENTCLVSLDGSADEMAILPKEDVVNSESNYNVSSNMRQHNACTYSKGNNENSIDFFIVPYSDCILYYKRQDTPDTKFHIFKDEDTVLIFMSPLQKLFLQNYGNRIVSMDGTYRFTAYSGFVLHTLLVLDDDDNEGFPVAFALSNRDDADVINIFLLSVKENAGMITPKTFISDIQLSYYNSWKCKMGCPEEVLFGDWYVTRAWNRNQNSKIKHKGKRKEIKIKMDSLRIEPDKNTFKKKLEELLSMEDEDTTTFFSYFRREYLKCTQQWAYCFRHMGGTNANTVSKSFHRVIKYVHANGKKIASLLQGLVHVINYFQKKLHDVLTIRLKTKVIHKLTELRNSHDQFVKEDLNNIKIAITENGWLVKSFQKKNDAIELYYTVVKVREACQATNYGERCNLMCTECNVCAHLYQCTCLQSAIKSMMCKHIHAVATTFEVPNEYYRNDKELSVPTPIAVQRVIKEKEAARYKLQTNEKLRKNIKYLCNEILEMVESADCTDTLESMKMLLNDAFIVGSTYALSSSRLHEEERVSSEKTDSTIVKTLFW